MKKKNKKNDTHPFDAGQRATPMAMFWEAIDGYFLLDVNEVQAQDGTFEGGLRGVSSRAPGGGTGLPDLMDCLTGVLGKTIL